MTTYLISLYRQALVPALRIGLICILVLPYLFAVADTETSPLRRHVEPLEYVQAGLAPARVLVLRDPGNAQAPREQLSRDAGQPAAPLVGPHPTLTPTTSIPQGRFMILRRPSVWTSSPGCTGRPPLACVAETFEEVLATHGVMDSHYLDDVHLIAYVPRTLLDDSSRDTPTASSSAITVTVLDAFAAGSDGGQWLKLSRDLRVLLDDAFVSSEHRSAVADQLFIRTANSAARGLRLGVWTLKGASVALKHELHSTSTFRPSTLQTSGEGGAANREDVITADLCSAQLVADQCTGICPDDHLLFTMSVLGEDAANFTLPSACARLLLRVASHPWVRWIEPMLSGADPANDKASGFIQNNGVFNPPTLLDTPEWLFAHPLWTAGINGSGEIVAIVDSGVDVDSCFFHDAQHTSVAYFPQIDREHRKVLSYLRARCDDDHIEDASDRASGHGTHVAGSAVGHVEGHETMSAYNGVATGAKLFVHDLGCPENPKLQLPTDFRDVFTPSYEMGARISCNSWGVDSPPQYSAMERMVDQYLYDHDDLLGIFAAGNTPASGPTRPGRTKNVLMVGSHRNGAGRVQDEVSSFSAHGPTYDGRQKPDVVAPGEPVQSAYSDGLTGTMQCAVTPKQGTSMSAALVAGGAALVRQYLRERREVHTPSAALVKAAIIHATHFLSATATQSGFGRVDLSLLIRTEAAPTLGSSSSLPSNHTSTATPRAPRLWLRDRVPIAHSESHAFWFSASVSSQSSDDEAAHFGQGETQRTQAGVERHGTDAPTIKATLVWTDVGSAAEGSTRSLVHDLDLTIVDKYGQLYYSHNRTNPRERHFDRTNNVEQIELPLTAELSQGFRVFVHGTAVLTRPTQPYALMVTAPGLTFYESYAALLDAQAQVQARGQTMEVSFQCPGNCSDSRGVCNPMTAQCDCLRVYQFSDCSQCNARVLCGGQSTCEDTTLKCTCDPYGHFEVASDCRSCQKGWFGEDCRFDCACENGGVCDAVHGTCHCPQDRSAGGTGCFQGPHCEYCCDGFGGDGCREVSYWCNESGALVEIDGDDGALIQVSGFDRYQTSMTCRWRIRAPAGHRVSLEVLKMDLETGYDFLNVYDTVNPEKAGSGLLIQRYTGSMSASTGVVSSGNTMDLVFVSDWEGTASGFQLRYRFVPATHPTACRMECSVEGTVNAMPNATANNQLVCAADLGLDDLCTCRAGFSGFHCEHALTATTPPVTTDLCDLAPPRASLNPVVSPHSAVLVPPAGDTAAHASLRLYGPVPPSASLFVNRLLSLSAAQLSARLPLSVNAPSQLDLLTTLVGEWPSQSVSLYEQQVRVQLRFQPLLTCPSTDQSPNSAHHGHAQTSTLSDLFGLSLVAYVHGSDASVPEKSTQVLSLYRCGAATPSPSIAVVLRSPGLEAVGDNGRVQLTFKASISVMLTWNATTRLPDGVPKPSHILDVAVVLVSANWLSRSVRGSFSDVNMAHALLLPWVCDDGATPVLAMAAGHLVEPSPGSECGTVVLETPSATFAQIVTTCCLGLACGIAVVLGLGHLWSRQASRNGAPYIARRPDDGDEMGVLP